MLRPSSLEEALRLLAENPGRVHLRDSIPRVRVKDASSLVMDLGRVQEMAGIARMRGYVVIGCNARLIDVARASLVRAAAMCLVEACEHEQSQAFTRLGGVLWDGPRPSLILLAVAALSAEIEYASLVEGGIERKWLPWDQFTKAETRPTLGLALALRFVAGQRRQGSALAVAEPPKGATSLVEAAGARLSLNEQDGAIAEATLTLQTYGRFPSLIADGSQRLMGRPATAEHIKAAAQAAGDWAERHLTVGRSESAYAINLGSFLARKALDKAVARALDLAPPPPF